MRELEALVVHVRATPALAYLLFDLQPEAAFRGFPITKFVFDEVPLELHRNTTIAEYAWSDELTRPAST